MLKVGQPAPGFSLQTGDGETIRLKRLRGKKVVLFFYPGDDTPTCTKEACSFQNNLPRLKLRGTVVLGVSADSVVSHKNFAKKFGLTYSLLSDGSKKVLKSYGVWGKKTLFGRTYMGIVRSTFVIDEEGRIAQIFSRVLVKNHVKDVLTVLDRLEQQSST